MNDTDARRQIRDVVNLVVDSLGGSVLGAYLHGSAVLGGLRPDSDVDVLVVLRETMTAEQRRAIVDGLLDMSGSRGRRGPARPIELTMVVQDDVRPWRYPPRSDFQYGEWLRDEYEQGATPLPTTSPDLAPLITMTLLGNRSLLGPPPGNVLDPVPHHDLRRALIAGVPQLREDVSWDTRNVVLTLARIWATLATGTVTAKDAAAAWAISHLPPQHRPVLAHARAVYLGHSEELWEGRGPSVGSYCDRVVAEIERLSP